MTEMHLKRVKDDDFVAVEPDSLMAAVSQTKLRHTLVLSLIGHLVVVLLLSLGNFGLCIKYRTVSLKSAMEQRDIAAKEMATAQQAEEAAARRAELKAKADAAAPTAGTTNAKTNAAQPKVLQDINEVSDERPTESSLDSIDDLLED